MIKFSKLSSRKWSHIVIHHSQSPETGNTYEWDQISAYHVKVQGWSAIGYHYGVERDDHGRLVYCVGRGLDCVGAHTQGMNGVAIGICLVGNYDIAEPTDTQYWFLAELCKDLMRDFQIPIENIHRHSEYNTQKTCPGSKFDMEALYAKIRTNGYKTPESVEDDNVGTADSVTVPSV